MQITVCDVCGKKNTYPLSLPYDRVYNGTDYDTPAENFDLCADHLYSLSRFLMRGFSHEQNIKVIEYINRVKNNASCC
jgi:hypothetical protein